jgi:hypothetical protein
MTTTQITRFLGQCPSCGTGVATDDGQDTFQVKRTVTCPACATALVIKRVEGVYSDSVPCDDRCMGAIGPKCICACTGRNHGVGYIPEIGERPVYAVKADQKRKATRERNATRKAEREATAAAARMAAIEAQMAEHPLLVWATYEDSIEAGTEGYRAYHLLSDIGNRIRWGWQREPLSDRQVEVVEKAVLSNTAYWAKRAAEQEIKAARVASGVRVPTGTGVKVEGRLTGIDWEASPYARNSGSWRGVLRHDDGWAVKITIPQALIDDAMKNRSGRTWTAVLETTRVRLVVDLGGPWVPKDETEPKDVLFGYGKRPRQAALLTPSTV